MGTIYSVACKTCKVVRDLDKFYTSIHDVETREDAIKFADEIKSDSFRAGLLVSFMGKHKDHDCIFFNEHSSFYDEIFVFKDNGEYVEDVDYWHDAKE